MKNFYRLIVPGLMIAVMLSSCAAGTGTAGESEASSEITSSTSEKKVIGVSLYYKKDEYYMDMESMLKKLAAENGYEILIQDANDDTATQTSQFEAFIMQKVDLIMFAPTDPNGMIPALKSANDAGIPVFAFDAAMNGGNLDTVVVLDNFKAGEEMGKWAKDYIEKNLAGVAEIAILDFPVATNSCVPRVEGFLSIVSKMPGVKIVARQDGKASRTDSMTATEDILTANPGVDLVFGINDNTIFGAIAAAETKGKKDIVFCDVGWSDELFTKLVNNDPYIKASALSSPFDVAEKLMDCAKKVFAGETLAKVTNSATYVLTSKNAAAFQTDVNIIRNGG